MTRGFTAGNSTRSCTLTVSAARWPGSAARQHGQRSGRCSTTSSGVSLITRLWPSCPGLAPPGLEFSRWSLRSVEGGLEEVREVFSGRCRRSTSSIRSSLLRRSSSPRPIPPLNQQKRPASRAWVIADYARIESSGERDQLAQLLWNAYSDLGFCIERVPALAKLERIDYILARLDSLACHSGAYPAAAK